MTLRPIDPETGLPYPPEGHFFRVNKPKDSFLVFLNLYKRRSFMGIPLPSKYVFLVSIGRPADVNSATVRDAAYRLLLELDDKQRAELAAQKEAARITPYLGDYPPKKLETS